VPRRHECEWIRAVHDLGLGDAVVVDTSLNLKDWERTSDAIVPSA
jgi:hypothetical protein